MTQLSEATSIRAPDVRVTGLRKSYGAVTAVAGVDLEILRGEFFTMLGPSGSGKTTTLRMIAGFEQPDAGTIELAGRDVSSLPPFDRDVNTVFQDYALFPHMSVQQNVEYGLRVKKVPKAERRQEASDALAMVRLEGYGDRKPAQLSGGQRQRVALARAIVNRPQALLLDEPLGALDLKLRQELQIELKQIQQELGMTFVYVTHDQEEALTMSDRIAVFNQGRIEQVGTPAEMYEHPRTTFVAGFIGTSNILERDGRTFTVRPEKIRLSTDETAEGEPGSITAAAVYLGPVTKFIVALDGGGELTVVQQNLETSSEDVHEMEGKRVRLSVEPGRGIRDRGGGKVKRIRFVYVAFAAFVTVARRSGGGCLEGQRDPDVGRGGRGQAHARRLGGIYREAVGRPVREGDRLQGVGEVRRQLERHVQPDDVGRRRPVRHGLGIRRCEPPADLFGCGRRGQRRPDPVVQGLLQGVPVAATNTVDGKHYGVSLQFGPNLLLYNTAKEKKPTSWSAIYDPKNKGKITIPDNPIQIADAALYLSKTKPGARDHGPVRADEGAARRGGRPAEAAASAGQEVLGARVGPDRPLQERRLDARRLVAVPDQQLKAAKVTVAAVDPEGGRHGLARHVDAVVEGEASELRLQVDAVHLDSRRPQAQQAVVLR